MPADTLRRAVPELSRSDADLMVACGDTFRRATDNCYERTLAVLAPLPFPIYQAVGNHDVGDRDAFTARFGRTWGAFVHGGCELDPWEISGEQLAFLRDALAIAGARDDVRAVFCFAHKLVFAHRHRYFAVLAGSNALDGLRGPNRFVADVLPLLATTARSKPVVWFGGDIGAPHTLSSFLDHDPVTGVTFAATGLGDRNDALLEVRVRGTGRSTDVRIEQRAIDAPSQVPPTVPPMSLAAWHEHFFADGFPAALEPLRARLPTVPAEDESGPKNAR